MTKRPLIVRTFFAAVATIGILCGVAAPAMASPTGSSSGAGIQIIGGSNATRPWAVSLIDFDERTDTIRHRCGGTLINPRWVLSAAHCMGEGVVTTNGYARVGSLQWNSGGTLVGIDQIFINPGYNGLPANDIALVKLEQPVNNPALLIPLGKVAQSGSTGIVAGWGTLCDTDLADLNCQLNIPDTLQQLTERRLANDECSLIDPEVGDLFNPNTMLCMVSADGQPRQACFADSGSPIVQKNKFGIWTVVGLVLGDGDDDGPLRPNLCTTSPSGQPGKIFVVSVGAFGHWIISTIVNN
jgi:secreted trypsin-like serine protease